MSTDGRYETMPKKEIAKAEKEKRKLLKNLEGIRHMGRLPDALFVVDTRKEQIAVDEARKLKIPVIGIVDTNCDPDQIDYVIPGNDDALRSVKLFVSRIADAVIAGRGQRESAMAEQAASRGRNGGGRRGAPHGAPGRHPQAAASGRNPRADADGLSRTVATSAPAASRPARLLYGSRQGAGSELRTHSTSKLCTWTLTARRKEWQRQQHRSRNCATRPAQA